VLAEVIGGMRDLLRRTLGPQVTLGFELDGTGVPVLSDPVQVEMAVLNLAINARDAMPEGGELVIRTAFRRIEADPELPPGEYMELSVTDTGTGMAPEVAARAFEPFFTTKGVGKGTGLGLSQVYGIARQGGGAARIETAPGCGTTVRLIRRMLAESLDALGYRVIEARDGPEGLGALEAETPDLVVVDFAMPGMNGAETAAAIRRTRPGLPIVFASGYADTAAIERVDGAPPPLLRKPFRLDELQAVLAGALGADGSRRAGEPAPGEGG
jgi:CheY-like chemotaxis protein